MGRMKEEGCWRMTSVKDRGRGRGWNGEKRKRDDIRRGREMNRKGGRSERGGGGRKRSGKEEWKWRERIMEERECTPNGRE